MESRKRWNIDGGDMLLTRISIAFLLLSAVGYAQIYNPPTDLGTPTSGVITNLTGTCLNCVSSSSNAVNTNTFPAAAGFTSGGIPYFSSTTAMGSSALLTQYGLLYGGGAAAAPVSMAACGATFPIIGSATAPACSTIGYPASLTQGGLLYASTTTAITSGAALTQYGVVLAGAVGSAPVSTAQGASNMPLIGQGAANPIFSSIAYPTSVTSGGACYGNGTTAIACGAILNANILTKGGGAGAAPTNSSITDDGKNITTAEVFVGGNKVFVTGDFTDSTSGTLVAITGLSYTLPTSKAVNVSFHCSLIFNQGTAAVSDSIGIGVTGTAPTQANAQGIVYPSASTVTSGNLLGLASTTPTAVVTFTPSAITTNWNAELNGTIEQPSNATPGVFNVYVSTTTGSDNLIVKRGSYCTLF